jgi:hypothetical protein
MRDQIFHTATPLLKSAGVIAEGLLSTSFRSC